MGEVARALGLPKKFDFEGKTYEMAGPEYEFMGEFEEYLEHRALRKIERMKAKLELEPAVYKARYDSMVARVGADTYTFGQPEFDKAMNSWEGQKELSYILLHARETRDAPVTRELVGRMFLVSYNELMARLALAQQQANPPSAPTEPADEATSPSSPSAPVSSVSPGV